MKPLKILLGNNTFSLLAGSETWTKTLAFQFKKMGHNVTGFSPELGSIADEMKESGIPCFSQMLTSGVKPFSILLEETQSFDYDVIIANHFLIVEYLRKQFPKTPIISTIHGILHTDYNQTLKRNMPAPEHPALTAGVNQFVAVSEEVQAKLKEDYNIESLIVRNFIDCDRYMVQRPASPDKPKVFLLNTNYADKNSPEVISIKEAAKHFGAKVIAVGMNFVQTKDVVPMLEKADVVFGMGRSVLEGVAAGRLGIVHGRWGTGGVICEQNIDELRSCNFSGRNASETLPAGPEQLIQMIEEHYKPETLLWGQNYIRREHNVVHAAEMYLQTARMLLGDGSEPQPAEIIHPYRLAKDVAPTYVTPS